ncbi:FAD-dependent oxidoreductase, partial [Thermodesulfobacteriota bacterium]
AVIGSGPAGLTAAYDLVRKGYPVKVFESSPLPGGMLTTGIPEFVLPRKVAMAEIDYIRGLGVDVRTNVTLGKDFTLDDLKEMGFKAVLLAIGNQGSAMLKIPGAELEGVHPALPFLKKVKLGEAAPLKGKVVVIGGGNVAMDAARTALRLGAGEVHVACLEARCDMPAFTWEVEATERERIKLHPALSPQEFTSRDGRRITGIIYKRVASTCREEDGRVSCTLLEGPASDYYMDVDAVIIAIGQYPEVPHKERFDLDARNAVVVNPETMATNIPGLFSAGDAVHVGATVIEAIADGHRAAAAIDCFLNGTEAPPQAPSMEVVELDPELAPGFFQKRERWSMPSLPSQDAIRCFEEVHLGLTERGAGREARRCLNCRSCVNCIFERGQLCFETASRLISERREA